MEEALIIDVDFDIQYNIYTALRSTISHAIDMEIQKDTQEFTVAVPKDLLLKNFLSRNIDLIDEDCYITLGPDNTVYLCGGWLLRPVQLDTGTVLMKDYLLAMLTKAGIPTEKLVFAPDKTGVDVRKELWLKSDETNSSYNVPKSNRNSFGEKSEFQRPPDAPDGPPFPPGMRMPPWGAPPAGMAGAMPPGMAAGQPPMGAGAPPWGAPPAGMAGAMPPGMAAGQPPMGTGAPPWGAPPAGMTDAMPPGMAAGQPPMGAGAPPWGAPPAGMTDAMPPEMAADKK